MDAGHSSTAVVLWSLSELSDVHGLVETACSTCTIMYDRL